MGGRTASPTDIIYNLIIWGVAWISPSLKSLWLLGVGRSGSCELADSPCDMPGSPLVPPKHRLLMLWCDTMPPDRKLSKVKVLNGLCSTFIFTHMFRAVFEGEGLCLLLAFLVLWIRGTGHLVLNLLWNFHIEICPLKDWDQRCLCWGWRDGSVVKSMCYSSREPSLVPTSTSHTSHPP